MALQAEDRRSLFRRGELLGDKFLEQFKCTHSDEVYVSGALTGEPSPPFACKFSSSGLHGNLLALVDEEGSVQLLDSRKPAIDSLIKEWKAHKNAVFDLAWSSDNHLVTASGDTKLIQWDLHSSVAINRFKGHSASVKSVDVDQSNPSVIVSCGRDGCILVWDTRSVNKDGHSTPVSTITGAHLNKSSKSTSNKRSSPANVKKVAVTAVLFHREHCIASSSAADGQVKLWDIRKMSRTTPTCCHTFKSPGTHGIASLVSDPYQTSLYASCMDNRIYVFDSVRLKTNPVGMLSGHQNTSFYIKSAMSFCGRFLLSGSSCGRAHIWDTQNPLSLPTLLIGHSKEVTAVAWSPYQLDKVVTCSDACDLRIWRAAVDDERSQEQIVGYAERSDHAPTDIHTTDAVSSLHSIENTFNSSALSQDIITLSPVSPTTNNKRILSSNSDHHSVPKRPKRSSYPKKRINKKTLAENRSPLQTTLSSFIVKM